ncbi:cytochrome P450 2K4-like [Protopterus annectens]|uniref:cytochrome P450 2K4-like n=1 Tax=Protopterus annectens TaxID=7888 RepID=UPI001CF93F12|nr:cytochrome P450 2K4-like [Protopterus annectens]
MAKMTVLHSFFQDIGTVQILCALLLFFLILVSATWKTSPFRMPPGPFPLPIIGNLHILDLKRLDKSLEKLSKKYGNVFTLSFGTKKSVVILGYEAAHDALVNHADEFGERSVVPSFQKLTNGKGLISSHGDEWKTMRRFALSTLRDFGMGKTTIEDRIHKEAEMLIKEIEAHKGQPFYDKWLMNGCTGNVICSIVLGKRFDYHDPIFVKLIQIVSQNVKLMGSPAVQLYNMFPFLGFLLGAPNILFRNMHEQRKFFVEFLKLNRQTVNENDIRSYVDAFMLKQQEEMKKPDNYFDEENLLVSTLNLFGAGLETTSSSLQWAFLMMIKYPEIQKKVQEEVDEVVGDGRLPTLEDRKILPYTDAVIHEVQRFCNIVTLPVGRETTCDTHFREYFIPKGTRVLILLSSVLFDKMQWESPDKFTPSHFLDAQGKFTKKAAFLPFSAGKRVCLGESLAKAELFLLFTALIQKFTFYPAPGVTSEDLNLEPDFGITSSPKYHLVCAVSRKQKKGP